MNQGIWIRSARHLLVTLLVVALSACEGLKKDDQAMVASAREYLAQSDVRAAAIELQNALQINSGNSTARYLLATINLDVGSAQVAEKEFRRALELGYPKQDVFPGLALALLEQGSAQQLLADIEVDTQWPATVQATLHAIRAAAYLLVDEPEQARDSLAVARELEPDNLRVLTSGARLKISEDRLQGAQVLLDRAQSLFPTNLDVVFLMAGIAHREGKSAEIKRLLNKVIELDLPKVVTTYEWRARMGVAQIVMEEGDNAQALRIMAPLMPGAQRDPQALYLLATISYRQKDYVLASQRLHKILEIEPDHRPALLMLGSTNYFLGEYEQAAYYLSKYVATVPQDMSARKLLGHTYLELDAHRQLKNVLAPVLERQQQDADVLAMLGMSALRTGQLQAGVADIERAVEMAPHNSRLRQYLARAYIISGEPDRAVKELERVLTHEDSQHQAEILLILAHLRAGDTRKAVDAAESMVRDTPNDPGVLTVAGNVHLVTGDPDMARRRFDSALKLAPGFLPAALALARVYEYEGAFDRAREHYEQIIATGDEKLFPMLALANLEERQGDMERMAYWLDQASQLPGGDTAADLALAEYHFRDGNLREARQHLDEVLEAQPGNYRARLLRIRMLMAESRYSDALGLLNELAEERPESLPVSLLLAETYLRLNRHEQAREIAARIVQKQDGNIPATMLLAAANIAMGEYSRALELARTLQALKPDWHKGYEVAADTHMAMGEYRAAEQAYLQAMQHSDARELTLKLVQAYLFTNRLQEAADRLQAWLKTHGRDARVLLSLGIVQQRMNDIDAALEAYRKVLELEPGNFAALNNLAGLYDQLNDPRALETAERAYRSNPEVADIQDTYGWLLTRNGRAGEGRELLKKALRGLPEHPQVRYHLAISLLETGDTAGAKRLLRELASTSTDFPEKQEVIEILDKL